MIKSKALEVNLVDYHVDVFIDEQYHCIQEVMSQYAGLADSLNVVLRELVHPYKNWQFIVREMTVYSLDYFYLFKAHNGGVLAAQAIIKIFIEGIESDVDDEVSSDAADSLIRYLNCIATESNEFFSRFIPIIDETLNWMKSSKSGSFSFFIKGFYSLRKLFKVLYGKSTELPYNTLNSVLARYLRFTYVYWLKTKDPILWLEENVDALEDRNSIKRLFDSISHRNISKCSEKLASIKDNTSMDDSNTKTILEELLGFPDHVDFVEIYKEIPRLLFSSVDNANANKWKVLFLFHAMSIVGLSLVHEDLLLDINRTVSWLIDNESHDYIEQLIDKTFATLEGSANQFPDTTFSCILTMGRGVYKTDQIDLVELFIDKVIGLGFETPGICGVGDDWQIRINDSHIKNIRNWLDLIKLKPKWSKRLMSSLIANLSVGGVLMKDTDLFPKDITDFLNSEIAPTYNLSKQLARVFPTYFRDIGAEGSLRDISTKLDEITCRQDVLIHFLRKQSHVESSNRIIAFIESVIKFWETKSKKSLKSFVPALIFSQIETEGIYVDGVNKLLSLLKSKGFKIPDDLLGMDEEISKIINGVSDVAPADIERVSLIANFYKLLHDKYNLDYRALRHHVDQLSKEEFPGLSRLIEATEKKDIKERISFLLDFLMELKSIVLSGETYKTKSEIYKKRHFAVDIPSTYGSYYELKFAALGLSFRVESLVNVLFEELNEDIDLSLITKATFSQIHDYLKLFDKALKIDGINSVEFGQQLDLLFHSLDAKEFTFTQYMDIFKGFIQAVKNIMNDYFHKVHEQNLVKVLFKLEVNCILPKYLSNSVPFIRNDVDNRIFEFFFRDRIATSLGLQQLDILLSRVHCTIFDQSNKLSKNDLRLLLNYNSKRTVTLLDGIDNSANSIIYMGSKGVNMQKLHKLGLPTPPCFIVTTEAFGCRNLINNFFPVKDAFRNHIKLHIEKLQKITGKKLGDLSNPMLLSVRSGSSVSQPGMMDTLVNVGLNIEIVEALAKKRQNKWFAWDSYRRFLGCYGTAFGLERNDFDDIVNEFKDIFNVPHKKVFSGIQMKAVALAYKSRIEQNGIDIPDDPFEQLYTAIDAVFASWQSRKARAYRSIMGISDDWGTAAVIQDMVFGNLSRSSGSGVFFTHNPRWASDALNLWGDFTIGGQGEDVVSGLVKTFPISTKQQLIELRDTNITLETNFPTIYDTIKEWANMLVFRKGWGPQEMEFTFEGPSSEDLYLLQTRDMSIRNHTQVGRFIPISSDSGFNKCLGVGIGVSGGAMNGRVVFTQEEINYWRLKEPETLLILLRRDTVPDDIREIFAADGLLTVKGGVTSHASVIAHRLGKTCVVGCVNLVCNDRDKVGTFGDVVIRSGDYISIDGNDGSVFLGNREIELA